MKVAELRNKVDFGIITIREDEHSALLRRLSKPTPVDDGSHRYRACQLPLPGGEFYSIAVLRCIEQGNTEALNTTRDLIGELAPALILVVGIGGAVPSSEFTLGDVVVSTRIVDFSVEAVIGSHRRTYALGGGPLHPQAAKIVADIRAMVDAGELKGWNSRDALGKDIPPIDYLGANYYGNKDWQKDVQEKMTGHFAKEPPRPPTVVTGAIASSDRLIKDDEMIQVLLAMARQVYAVEMESAGAYKAAHRASVPFFAIRGISDVVGFKRDPAWVSICN